MRVISWPVVLLLSSAVSVSCAQRRAGGSPPGMVRLVIETERGDIAIVLDSTHAPATVTNFLRYVDGGFYTGGRFHRTVTPLNQPNDTVRIEVIQAGADSA